MGQIWSSKVDETTFNVHQISVLKDNFCYILTADNMALVIDPSVGKPIAKEIKDQNLKLEAILITHHHSDHIGGVEYLKNEFKCPVVGPSHEVLTMVDQDVVEEEESSIGPFSFEVLSLPGHTLDHVGYYFPECSLFFSGDTLFLSGCGKMFEGTEQQYFHSLQKIKDLPDKTVIFPGHDDIKRNTLFAKSVFPDNSQQSVLNVTFRMLKEELKYNPFLQAKTPDEFLDLRQKLDEFPEG